MRVVASEPSSSSRLLPWSDERKKETPRWPQRPSKIGCFAYTSDELRPRDSRVFFVRTSDSSVSLGCHVRITRVILADLRSLSLSK